MSESAFTLILSKNTTSLKRGLDCMTTQVKDVTSGLMDPLSPSLNGYLVNLTAIPKRTASCKQEELILLAGETDTVSMLRPLSVRYPYPVSTTKENKNWSQFRERLLDETCWQDRKSKTANA